MKSGSIKVCHFHNGSGGGVLSVISNLLLYKHDDSIENYVIYTIDLGKSKNFLAPGLIGAASEKVFYYSSNWNFYYTCRQLAKLLPDDKAVIVAHDWLELGMVSNLGLQNPVVQFLHGDYDYYYQLAIKHQQSVDMFICVAASIRNNLLLQISARSSSIVYQRFPVSEVDEVGSNNQILKVAFIGRCEKAKGFDLIPSIAIAIKQRAVQLEWHIVGEGSMLAEIKMEWPKEINVKFYDSLQNEAVLKMIPAFDFLILPSIAEGMPVTVIEAMKAGVIPVTNDLAGGLKEIIIDGETGYRINGNKPEGYAEVFANLCKDQLFRKNISRSASALANKLFDPVKNSMLMEELFLGIKSTKMKLKKKVYGSRLDQPWLPNIITKSIRLIN